MQPAMQTRAHAKINLSLHITGRRADGYHLLDSLVAFAAETFDTLEVFPDRTLRLSVEGGADIPLQDNLVMKAARLLQNDSGIHSGARIRLAKRLPMGGGIGGGSADAAATLHMLNEFWQLNYPLEKLMQLALPLGADVPVCVYGQGARMQGIGEQVAPFPLPKLHAVLVNPGVHVDTRAVFAAGIPAGDPIPPQGNLPFPAWLAQQRNDLEFYARDLAPVIGEVLAALKQEQCWLARMSGSGSTCFGLFADKAAARKAATAIKNAQPDWWVVATALV